MIIKKTIINLNQYIKLVTEIASTECTVWFRGHSSAAYRLTPTVLRETIPNIDSRGNKLRGNEIMVSSGFSVTGPNPERMLDEFKRKARPFIEFLPKNDFEWLFLMQHHGVPTRLLDWTTNALVALYFAVESLQSSLHKSNSKSGKKYMGGDEFLNEGAAVFAINPEKINKEAFGIEDIFDVAENYESWKHYAKPMDNADLNPYSPICIFAPHISPRIRAQSGIFTLHGSNIWALDYYEVLRPLIRKIFIPYSSALKIKEELSVLGITRSFIFPDLDGVSLEIKEQELKLFSYDRKNHLVNL